MRSGGSGTFVVARNPEPDSTLPYLIRLPLPGGDLVLKARETWPRTARVYCHRADGWPEPAEVLEEVPVRSCLRRGVAIDLVLDRGRENRSQLVFARIQGGREGIFWQTARTAARTRPGIRIPTRRASGQAELVIWIDTRERYPYRFARQQTATLRRTLPVGDYGVALDDELVAVVERKTLADLSGSLVDGTLNYALAELATLPRAAVVVEDRYADVFKLEHVAPGFVAELLATVQVRYPSVPIVFAETRPLAEEWTFRWLGAALRYAEAVLDEAAAEIDRPEIDGSETDRPEIGRPEIGRPETDRPETDRSETDRPETDRSETDRPETDRLETDGARSTGPRRPAARRR